MHFTSVIKKRLDQGMSKIDKFMKWFIASFVLGIVGLVAVFFVEDIARITGEFNRSILLIGALTVFFLILTSLFSLIKANSKRIKRELVISVLFALILLAALIFNGLIFIVYFIGK